MCGSGGDSWSGAGNLGLDGGHLLGVWGIHGEEEKGEKEWACMCGSSSVYMCRLV